MLVRKAGIKLDKIINNRKKNAQPLRTPLGAAPIEGTSVALAHRQLSAMPVEDSPGGVAPVCTILPVQWAHQRQGDQPACATP